MKHPYPGHVFVLPASTAHLSSTRSPGTVFLVSSILELLPYSATGCIFHTISGSFARQWFCMSPLALQAIQLYGEAIRLTKHVVPK